MSRRVIFAEKAPAPVGAYSHGVIVDNLYYSTGQIGLNPETNTLVEGGIVEEARQAMKNMGTLLEAAGSGFDKLVKVNLLITDVTKFKEVDDVYKEFVTESLPGRMCAEVTNLPAGAQFSIEVIAYVE